MSNDIRRVVRAKNRLQRLEKSIGGITVLYSDIEAKKRIQEAIGRLHEAELILRRREF